MRLRHLMLWTACLVGSLPLLGQVTVSPQTLDFQGVEGWMVSVKQITITSAGGWWIKSSANWFQPSSSSGTGNATVKVSLVNWAALPLRAGEYTGTLSYGVAGSESPLGSVAVRLRVVEGRVAPRYTYLKGPNGCVQPMGYEDAAICTVPEERPPGSFNPPPVGGTYIDPNFGALVHIATKPASWHSYASPSALNANNKYLFFSASTAWHVGDAFSGKIIRERTPVGEGSMWDAKDPDVLYDFGQSSVIKYNVATNRSSTVIDYAKTQPTFTSIRNGGGGDTSKDNWISFFAPAEKQVCALDLNTVRTFCASYENRGPVTLDPSGRGTLISKGVDRATGKRYVMLIAAPAMAVFSVNEPANRLDFEYLAPERVDARGDGDSICEPGDQCYVGEHSDTFEDANGIQYLVGTAEISGPCSYNVSSYRLNAAPGRLLEPEEVGGGARRLALLQRCGDVPWADLHMSCAKHAAICAVSTTYGGTGADRAPDDQAPFKRTPHLSEIFVIKDNGAEIRRLVQHRSVKFKNEDANGYWSTPRASISYDGTYVAFTSNFGMPNQQRVAIAETGYGPTMIAAVVDSAAFGNELAPGALATIFGTNLANCNEPDLTSALPIDQCGTRVRVADVNARLIYVSTRQLNVVLPTGMMPGKDHVVSVIRGTEPVNQSQATLPGAHIIAQAPAIFAYSLDDGVRRAIVQNFDTQTLQFTRNGPPVEGSGWVPQIPGQVGVVYASNLGLTDPVVPDGILAPADPPAAIKGAVDVFVNGIPQQVLFAGLTPGFAGLYQINYLLGGSTPILNDNLIWLMAGGYESEHLAISLAARP